MESENKLTVFEDKNIRSILHKEETYFAIVDIVEILTDSPRPRQYWSKIKTALLAESQSYPFWIQLKVKSADGKFYATDCANTEGVLRIIQSVPSPKAEPFKMWLAGLGKQALDEQADPELMSQRQAEIYRSKGYPEDWIAQRLQTIDTRKELTAEWQKRGVKEGQEYAALTATVAKGTFGLSPSEHSKLKGLDKENLRDHMSRIELIFTALSEEATRIYAENDDVQGFNENHEAAVKGGTTGGNARRNFERETGRKVVSEQNFLALGAEEKQELPEG